MPQDDRERLELLLLQAQSLFNLGEITDAQRALEEAIGGARATAERELELRASIRLEANMAWLEPEGAAKALAQHAREAIAELGELGDELALAEAWDALVFVHLSACNAAWVRTAAEQVLVHAGRAGDRHLEQSARMSMALAAVLGPTPADAAISELEQLLSEATSPSIAEAGLLVWLGGLRSQRGEIDEGRRLAAQGQARHRELGHERMAAANTMHTAQLDLRAGDAAAAEAQLKPAHEHLKAIGEKGARCGVAAILAEALYRQKCLDEAEEFTRVSEDAAATDDVIAQVWWRGVRAKVLARRGDRASAVGLARQGVELSEPSDLPVMKGQAYEALGETFRLVGEADEARTAYEHALGFYEQKGDVADAGRVAEHLRALESSVS
jgi:tetratricopeptide (TPR) repeat protein